MLLQLGDSAHGGPVAAPREILDEVASGQARVAFGRGSSSCLPASANAKGTKSTSGQAVVLPSYKLWDPRHILKTKFQLASITIP